MQIVRKITFWFSLVPYSFLIAFYTLIWRYNIKYNTLPIESFIDPKEIGMDNHIFIIDLLLMLSVLSLLSLPYSLYIVFKNKNKIDVYILFSQILAIVFFIYCVRFDDNSFWYFD